MKPTYALVAGVDLVVIRTISMPTRACTRTSTAHRRIAEVRGLEEGQPAVSPSRFPDWGNLDGYRLFAAEVREATDGIRIGVKLSARQPHLRRRLKTEMTACQLDNFCRAATELIQVIARACACARDHLNRFYIDALTTWDREMAHLTGIAYGGVFLN